MFFDHKSYTPTVSEFRGGSLSISCTNKPMENIWSKIGCIRPHFWQILKDIFHETLYTSIQKIQHTGNNWPSRMCLIQEYQYYTIRKKSIQWVLVYTMSPSLHHELGLYHESFCIFLYRTLRLRKKSYFTSEKIQF